MNKSKAKGTAFETACVRYLEDEIGQAPYRAALHGNHDLGDVHGITVRDMPVVVECKCYKSYAAADVATWRNQTLVECANAGAPIGLLIIKQPGTGVKSFGRNRCDIVLADLLKLLDAYPIPEGLDGEWVTLDLMTACKLIRTFG